MPRAASELSTSIMVTLLPALNQVVVGVVVVVVVVAVVSE